MSNQNIRAQDQIYQKISKTHQFTTQRFFPQRPQKLVGNILNNRKPLALGTVAFLRSFYVLCLSGFGARCRLSIFHFCHFLGIAVSLFFNFAQNQSNPYSFLCFQLVDSLGLFVRFCSQSLNSLFGPFFSSCCGKNGGKRPSGKLREFQTRVFYNSFLSNCRMNASFASCFCFVHRYGRNSCFLLSNPIQVIGLLWMDQKTVHLLIL